MAGLSPDGRADAAAFLSRLVRLDPAALVRLRPADPPAPQAGHRIALWARLPWEVLVTRSVTATGPPPGDITVSATELLAHIDPAGRRASPVAGSAGVAGWPPRRDVQWRWRLPPSAGEVVERVPAAEILRVAEAAARTLRDAGGAGIGGRPVGERALRDALLDHVPIVVETYGRRVEVTQRLVQALRRMGFLGALPDAAPQSEVGVLLAPGWVGLAAGYGSAWQQTASPFTVRTLR